MRILAVIFLLLALALNAGAENRFPKPQFEQGYTVPVVAAPDARSVDLERLDFAVLFLSLTLASWLVLKQRSRRGVFLLSIFSVVYFGFWRKGCICSIGAIQNVTLWLMDSQYAIPVSAVAFFILPLVFALVFGRVFCAAVCPLGAIQDLMVLFPVRVPRSIALVLGFIPYIYLGLGVLFAAVGASFLICRFDPFVPLFRLNGDFSIVLFGIALLLAGMFIARPYCRFICPFSVLLNWMSRLSRWHVTITPDECVKCRLCEKSCPFDAIVVPDTGKTSEARGTGIGRLKFLLLLLPVLVVTFGWMVSMLDIGMARIHPSVQFAEALQKNDQAKLRLMRLEMEAFESGGAKKAELYAQVGELLKKFRTGGWLLGGFVGAVLGCSLIGVSMRMTRVFYEPDRGACLSCARCFGSCPVGRKRIGM